MENYTTHIVRSFPELKVAHSRLELCRTAASQQHYTTAAVQSTMKHTIHQLHSVMKVRSISVALLLFFAHILTTLPLQSQVGQGRHGLDVCGSPRFLVKTGDQDAFHLKSTDVKVNIIGVIADVRVRQVYFNSGKSVVSATYIFPASTRAAVYGLTMLVQDRLTKATIKEKEEARQVYNNAVRTGHVATLLEQIRPNVFQMSVGNILASDSVVVELHYTEAIDYASGIYEFVYPGVVGPRYVSSALPKEYDQILSGLDLPKEVPGSFHIETTIASGVPVKSVESPSHKLDIKTLSAATMAPAAEGSRKSLTSVTPQTERDNNRDVVIRYRLSGQELESGLLLSDGEDEKFFMLMVQPPRAVKIPHIVPREYVFIVDVSGSMWGRPLEIAQSLMNSLLDQLRPEDKFNVLCFSGGNRALAENSLSVTAETRDRAKKFLASGYGGGGTELLPALKRAFAMNAEPGMSRNFVAITDGFVQCEREAFDLVRKSLDKANFYAFGIGTNVNRFLMEGLARAGNAAPMIVTDLNEAPAQAKVFLKYIEAPVLTHIKVDYDNFEAYDIDPISIADVTAERPIVVFGKWKGNANGHIRLSGTTSSGIYDFDVDVKAEPIRSENSALRYLWARNRVRMIQDGQVNTWGYSMPASATEKEAITKIGLKYNLLTDYTSFVAVDSVVSVSQSQAANKTFKSKENETLLDSTKMQRNVDRTDSKQNSSYQGEINSIRQDSVINSQQVALTTTGVLSTGGGISIRGGRTGETKFLTDDQEIQDPIQGGAGAAATSTGNLRYAPKTNVPAKVPSEALNSKKKTELTNSRLTTDKTANTPPSPESNTATTLSSSSNGTTNTAAGNTSNNSSQPANTAPMPSTSATASNSNSSTVNASTAVTVQSSTESNKRQPADVTVVRSSSAASVSAPTLGVSTSNNYSDGEADALAPAAAPSRLFGGITFSLNSNLATSTSESRIDPPLNSPIYMQVGSMKALGYNAGIYAEYLLGPARNSNSSLFAELSFGSMDAKREWDQRSRAYKPGSVDTVFSIAHAVHEMKSSVLHVGFFFKYNIPQSRFGFHIGPTLDWSVSYSRKLTAQLDSGLQWYRLIDNTVLPTDNNGTRLIAIDESYAQRKPFRVGFSAGLHYEFILRKMTITPYLRYDYALTNSVDGISFSIVKLGLNWAWAW